MGELNPDTARLADIKPVQPGNITLQSIEKNWVPFEFPENSGNLYYIYSAFPHKIIELCNNGSNKVISDDQIAQTTYCPWNSSLWGEIRGGTPARLIDGVYLTFFHSRKFNTEKKEWFYSMGAYIFKAELPFKILAITPRPIEHSDFYTARHRVENLHVIYPAGFVIENNEKQSLLHVACGENDTSIRIVTIDKNLLFASMKPIL